MTVPLSPDSPRRDHARRFGDELRRAMKARGVGTKPLSVAAGVAGSSVGAWRGGQNLPRHATALRVADALSWPKLAEIAREARTGRCPVDGRVFVHEGGSPRRFCSSDCRDHAARGRARSLESRREAVMLLRGELLRTGPARKQAIGKALTLLGEAGSSVVAERRLAEHVRAVEAFCLACSPDGCQQPECELRPVSPVPLVIESREAAPVTRPAGRWGRPGSRERHGSLMRDRWADPVTRPRHERGITAAQEWRHEHPEAFAAAVRRGRKRTA